MKGFHAKHGREKTGAPLPKSILREGKIYPKGFHILSALLLLAAVVLSARFCAFQTKHYIQKQADSAELWILQEQTITRGVGLQLLDNQIRYAASFGVGFIDAMIRFENIPYDPSGAFLSLWKGMNPGVLVQKVEFLDHAVRVSMICENYDSLEMYKNSLVKEDYFSSVLSADLVTSDHQIQTVMTCLFA